MADVWGETPQEALLDAIYEGLISYGEGFLPEIFGVTDNSPTAYLYVEDPDGNCWEITAKPHPHNY